MRSPLAQLSALLLSLITASAVLSGVSGCGGGIDDGNVSYADSALTNYEKGMKALSREQYLSAAKYFAYVKSQYPFSRYAVLSELRLADADLESDHPIQAADGYRAFIKEHANHEMVQNGYAQFRIADAYYRQLPEEWALAPPPYEKDQSATEDALSELDSLVERYPSSPYFEKGVKMRKKVVQMLASHEYAIASFYWRRDRPRGTILRLETMLERYPYSAIEPKALDLLARAYLSLDRPDHAKRKYELIIARHPKSSESEHARTELPKMDAKIAKMKLP